MTDIDAFVEGRGRLGRLLRELPAFQPPPGLRARVLAALPADAAEPGPDGGFDPPPSLALAVLAEAARLDRAQASRRERALRDGALRATLGAAARRWLDTQARPPALAPLRRARPGWLPALAAALTATLALGVALQLVLAPELREPGAAATPQRRLDDAATQLEPAAALRESAPAVTERARAASDLAAGSPQALAAPGAAPAPASPPPQAAENVGMAAPQARKSTAEAPAGALLIALEDDPRRSAQRLLARGAQRWRAFADRSDEARARRWLAQAAAAARTDSALTLEFELVLIDAPARALRLEPLAR